MRYEVAEHYIWQRDDGKRASIHGACPWTSPQERSRWQQVSAGFVIYNPRTGQYGNGRAPHATREACQAYADSLGQPSSVGIGD